MKSTKKEAEGQIISVDAKKLAEGLKVTFEGVALVFSSLGMSSDIRSLDEAAEALGKDYKEPATKSVSKKKKEEKNDEID